MAFEKVNPYHPDKVADRIAGALVDYAYGLERDPKIAVEVLIGHGYCNIIAETSVKIDPVWVSRTVDRIAGNNLIETVYREYEQDKKLAMNQFEGLKCGDNGIFKGVPVTREQRDLTNFVGYMAKQRPQDGKYILDGNKMVICQSGLWENEVQMLYSAYYGKGENLHDLTVNPLGKWSGGIYVDSGATNRKLGSDMGDSVTGGGLHGKDLSKADVSVNIYCWLKAQEWRRTVEQTCAIGDKEIEGVPYPEIVETAWNYIEGLGGFEKFAEWGLIRPVGV